MTIQMPEPKGTLLGHATKYAETYSPGLLQPIARSLGRDAIGAHDFRGVDVWRLYEFSWLETSGLPVAAVVELGVPASTPSIIESKSLKLYAMSFAMSVFESEAVVAATLSRDLGYELEEVAQMNVDKLRSRMQRHLISGNGDNR